MPITFHFKPEVNLVILVHVGTIPDDEYLATYRSLYENNLFDISMNRLVDLRQSDSSQRSVDTLRLSADFIQKQFAKNKTSVPPKVAIIAPNDLFFGLSRMYEVFAGNIPWEFVVFRSADAALAWLGLPLDIELS